MIRRFFSEGLGWVAVAFVIVGIAALGACFAAPAVNPVVLEQQR